MRRHCTALWIVGLWALLAIPARADQLGALESILKRASVRLYDDRPVSGAQLKRIVKAGWNAATVDGTRPFEFVVIRDRGTLEQLAGATKFAKWMPGAPAAIAVVTRRDLSRHHVENGIQAVTNMYHAAQEQGLGTCFVGTAKRSEMKKILGLTGKRWKGRHLLTVLPIGHPKTGKEFKSPARVPLAETVFDGRFGQPTDALRGSRVIKSSTRKMADFLGGEQREVLQFSKTRVGKDRLRTALEMMRAAPSSKNRQPWRVVLVRDAATKQEIASAAKDPVLAQAPVVAVLATSLKPPPVRFGTQEQHDPHNNVKAGARLTRYFIRRHDPSFALANLRMGVESLGLGARVVMLNRPAQDVARTRLSTGRPIGLRNMHMLAAVGIGHVQKSQTRQTPRLPRNRVLWRK